MTKGISRKCCHEGCENIFSYSGYVDDGPEENGWFRSKLGYRVACPDHKAEWESYDNALAKYLDEYQVAESAAMQAFENQFYEDYSVENPRPEMPPFQSPITEMLEKNNQSESEYDTYDVPIAKKDQGIIIKQTFGIKKQS